MNGFFYAKTDYFHGSIWYKVLAFAIPLALTNVLQQLFNSVDTVIVGRFCGNTSLAAVGSTGVVINLFITVFSGIALGGNIVISRSIGAGDEEGVRKSVHTSFILSILCGVVFMIIGEIIAVPLLRIMSTPEDIIGQASLYLRIYFIGNICRMIYQFEAAILRSCGDTRRPLFCLVFSGVSNVGLNLLFVVGFHMGVAGVAAATIISEAVSAGLLLYILLKERSAVRLEVQYMHADWKIMKNILKNGIPAGIQGAVFNLANLIIQSGLNTLGSKAIAASTIGLTVEVFVYYLIISFAQASTTMNSQNLGAGERECCIRVTRWCVLFGLIGIVMIGGGFILFRFPFAGLYSSDADIIALAAERILIMVLFEPVNMIAEVMAGTIRGLGSPFVPTGIMIIFVCGARLTWMFLMFPKFRNFEAIIAIYPVSWSLAAIALVAVYIHLKRKLLK